MSALFSSFSIHNISLKNRIVVSPMCQYSSVDGFANDWYLVHLGTRGKYFKQRTGRFNFYRPGVFTQPLLSFGSSEGFGG